MKILIVDDEMPIREWVAECAGENLNVESARTAHNGGEALDVLSRYDADLVLTDITMPGMDGIELLKRIRQTWPNILVVIMSVHESFAYVRTALKLGAQDYILKNEIGRDGIHALIDKMSALIDGASAESGDAAGFDNAIQYKYIRKLLLEKTLRPTVGELAENRIALQDGPIVAFAAPNNVEAVASLNLTARFPALTNLVCILYGDNKLALLANLAADAYTPEAEIAACIHSALGGNVGYSRVYPGVGALSTALQEAHNMREYLYYSPNTPEDFVFHPYIDQKAEKSELVSRQNSIIYHYKMHRYEKTHSEIAALYEYLDGARPFDISFVKANFIALCQRLYNNSASTDVDIRKLESDIQHSDTLEQTRAIVDPFCAHILSATTYSEKICAALDYISAHFCEPVSLSSAAEAVHINSEYFSRLFKKEVGENFSDYLTGLRMKEAERLLLSTDLKIAEIAERVGVANVKYFALLFKKHFHLSPSQLREETEKSKN